MDKNRFDAAVRILGTTAVRRGAIRLLVGGVLGGALGLPGAREAAARCTRLGRRCRTSRECCRGAWCSSSQCLCKPIRKACRGRCIPREEPCCDPGTVACRDASGVFRGACCAQTEFEAEECNGSGVCCAAGLVACGNSCCCPPGGCS